jgi:methyl acetate hydrolase
MANKTTNKLDAAITAAVTERRTAAIAAISLDRAGNIIYKKTAGTLKADDPTSPTLTSSTPMIIYSLTKLVTCTAALQLIEQGKISLDDAAEKYVPDIAKLQLLEGFDDKKNEPILRDAKNKITIRHLLTHTSGLTYDFFHAPTNLWKPWDDRRLSRPPPTEVPQDYLRSDYDFPLTFEPGTGYAYGKGIDWLGFVIEAVSGMGLDKYLAENIFKPLGMVNTGVTVPGADVLGMHIRTPDGKATCLPFDFPAFPLPFGGASLRSSLDDYSTLLLTLLNEGTHPTSKVKILAPETVRDYVFADHLTPANFPDMPASAKADIGVVVSQDPIRTNDGELFPGVAKGWSCAYMTLNEAVPGGMSAGSGVWAGLNNHYYWIDPKAGRMGLFMTSLLPFMDKESLALFDMLEKTVYQG